MSAARGQRHLDWLIGAVGFALAVSIRYSFLFIRSQDFVEFVRGAHALLKEGGLSAISHGIPGLTPPYLYLLYIPARWLPDLPATAATKLPAFAGDFVAALLIYLLVRLRWPDGPLPVFAAFVFLITPTVVFNSTFLGQADVLFTAPLIACLYFLVIRRPSLALIAFGISLAFKLQAIFLAPLLLGLLLRRQVKWYHFLWIPFVLFLAIIPAWIAGRPLLDLILVYAGQVKQYQLLQMTAPTVYTWMPDVGLTHRFFTVTGVMFTAVLGLVFAFMIYRSEAPLTVPLLLKLALVCVLFMSFFLPMMHDRYFYPADVIAILYAFFFPQYFCVPVVIILASFLAYHPTLFEVDTVPMAVLAVGMFAMLLVVARDAVLELLSSQSHVDAVQTQ